MKFKKVYIEITNICNLSCSFCPKLERKAEFMKTEDFKKIINEVKEFTDYIYLHIKGEPILHPNITEFIDYAHHVGLKMNITTNGTILKPELLELDGLRQFNFSLHSFEKNDMEGKKDYINSILNYANLAAKKGKICSLRLWNIKDDNMQINNNDIFKEIENFFQLKLAISQFERGKGIKLAANIYLNFEEVFSWPQLSNKIIGDKGFCYGLNSHMGILVDGTVIPCCLDDNGIINLGNIKKNSLREILSSKRAIEITEGFKNRICVEELCKRCEFKERF